ncbi:hypothetical protein H4696_008033 [Amycolatopsis lexingtonensis]|uniref:Uncharacterized protein n=1 Tax=Amycolatopsis lexingtonensis TaxID=218822 RepID=A0ABR9ICM7_9PSEU|nr:hypothetical protein [Amycolatopsis lexingtonensis]MBE1500933.1 hypothetical protein [Amycolatopsis lexingtonensis]
MAARVTHHHRRRPLTLVPRCWQRGQALAPVTEARLPEPAQLYSLITLTLLIHEPGVSGCLWCEEAWPCPSALQAYRLREGF